MILVFANVNSSLLRARIAILKRLGEDVVVVANADCDEVDVDVGFKIIRPLCCKNRTLRYIASTILTFWLILGYRPKLIIIHWGSRLWQTLAFLPFRERLLVSCMGGDIDKAQDFKGQKAFWASILLKNAAAVTVKSLCMKQMLMDNVKGIKENRIHMISWGVSECFTTPQPDDELQAWSGGATLFFCVRAMQPFYRKEEVLNAFLHFKREGRSSAKLAISTLRPDKAYLDSLREIAKQSEFADDILFFIVPHERMPMAFASCDAVISFAPSDGLPQSFMEALAVGVFVIASNIEHYDELLHPDNSILCDDEYSLSKAFLEVDSKRPKPGKSLDAAVVLDIDLQTYEYLEICESFLASYCLQSGIIRKKDNGLNN